VNLLAILVFEASFSVGYVVLRGKMQLQPMLLVDLSTLTILEVKAVINQMQSLWLPLAQQQARVRRQASDGSSKKA